MKSAFENVNFQFKTREEYFNSQSHYLHQMLRSINLLCVWCLNKQINSFWEILFAQSLCWVHSTQLPSSASMKTICEHMCVGYILVEPAWLWYSFPGVRNRKETESGLIYPKSQLQPSRHILYLNIETIPLTNLHEIYLHKPHESSSSQFKKISSMSICVAVRQDSHPPSSFVRHACNCK